MKLKHNYDSNDNIELFQENGGWNYHVRIRDPHLPWIKLNSWLDEHVGTMGVDWGLGRFSIFFKTEEHAALFVLTWL